MFFLKNAADLSQHRIEIFDGEEHLVIPVVAAIQGVLNGQFLPMSSLEASLPAWEGVSITMSHPKKLGEDVSANTKFAFENFVVGRFFNAIIEDNKFKGEFWINLSKINEHEDGKDFLALVEEGATIEVSTAYWCTTDNRGGIYNGTQYSGTQTNIIPNHVAILLHEVGACSVADGCGAPRTNQETDMDNQDETITEPVLETNCDDDDRASNALEKLKRKFGETFFSTVMDGGLELNRISHDAIRRNIRELLTVEERSDTFIFIVDVFNDEVIYGRELPSGEVDLFSRNYTLGSSPGYEISLEDPVEVEQVVTYEPVGNSQEEESHMDRDALIERLAKNESIPFTREQFADMDDAQLTHLAANLEDETTETETTKTVVADPVVETVEDASAVQNALTPEVAAALNVLGADGITQITNAAKELAQDRDNQKKTLVSKLVANDRVTMDEATLRRMDLEALEGVARMAGVATSYAAMGGPVVNHQEETSGPPPPPSCVLDGTE